MEVLTVKMDAGEAIAAIQKVLEPGCILLPAEAVAKLHDFTGVSAADLVSWGGIEGTGSDEVAG